MLSAMFTPSTLRSAREAAEVTQAEAAYAVGSDVRSIRNWETGVHPPSVEVLATLAGLYGVHPGEFFLVHVENGDTPLDPRGKSHEPDTAAVEGSAGLAHQGA